MYELKVIQAHSYLPVLYLKTQGFQSSGSSGNAAEEQFHF
jgi:hypothetical protein